MLLDFQPQAGRSFRLRYDDGNAKTKWYLASIISSSADVRERNYTTFVSVGSSEEHCNFKWKMDDEDALVTPLGQKLAAHRFT